MTTTESIRQTIQQFLSRSRELNGCDIQERRQWNHQVTADSIRHVAYGISDDNPLWLDPTYASRTRHERLMAPPAYLTSVLYPILHGAPMVVPLSSLIADLTYEWFHPVLEGDAIRASAKQLEAIETRDRQGQPLVCIVSETRYSNQSGIEVGVARATLARALQQNDSLRVQRDIYRYSDEELERIIEAQYKEHRTNNRPLYGEEVNIGEELPPIVRGPLTIGDLICWQSAIGPSYRPGSLGYRDTRDAPHLTVTNPLTGWPVAYSQQHEDFLLASQRGMPAPFDNGVMRFAWLSPLLTNWMGDDGWLQRMTVRLLAPNLYGDTTWYRGVVVDKTRGAQSITVRVEITGVNQLGETNTSGEAWVVLPATRSGPNRRSAHFLGKRNNSQHNTGAPELLHKRVESLAERFPKAVAVVSGARKISYAGLNQRSNQLARRLQSTGVVSGSTVGICLERSADWFIAGLAVLKSGATFVSLDPTYPAARLQNMLVAAGSNVLITRKGTELPLLSKIDTLIDIDAEWDLGATQNVEFSPTETSSHALAYVIFTSGTTGVPDAVAVPHRSLSLCLDAMRKSLDVSADDVFIHTASFSFSAAMRQAFLPLFLGATVVVADETCRHDPISLFELMQRHRVTVWDTTPTVLHHSVDILSDFSDSRTRLRKITIRSIFVTGEALTWDLIRRWRELAQNETKIVNLYSQSETAGTASIYTIPAHTEKHGGFVPLGHAVPHTQLYVLGADRRPVPKGTVGEIWVGGNRLAHGYLNRPELTFERFTADPFRDSLGARIYRTGDLGRRTADDIIEFIGRVDDRLNIRGYRIEPGEVEAVISDHPDVKQVVTLGRENPTGENRLVAYVAVRTAACPVVSGEPRYRLPNGLAIAHLNKHETEFTYRAVFEDQTYLKHGITIDDGDCVLDVGANIGLFSLFVGLVCKASRIFSFEPNPDAFAALVSNVRLYDLSARTLSFGLGQEERNASFTAFNGFSILSGLHADAEEEKKLVRTLAPNLCKYGPSDKDDPLKHMEEILCKHFRSQTFDVPMRTLSSIIDEEGIKRIDLLKINVEKSELGVLAGIREYHWERIDQVIIKVDLPDAVTSILQMLERHGFEVVVDQDDIMEGSRVQTVYAVRPSETRSLIRNPTSNRQVRKQFKDTILSPDELRQFASRSLPEYMVPSFFVILEELPRTPNGKVDRQALPEFDWTHVGVQADFVSPNNEIQRKLARIWADVLGVKQVGVHDNFIELGGDSIKAVRVINQIRVQLNVDLPITGPFTWPTVATLAEEVARQQGK